MKKRILVTGGAGFIGSHLCELLLKEGNEVLCVVERRAGHPIAHPVKKKNNDIESRQYLLGQNRDVLRHCVLVRTMELFFDDSHFNRT